MANPRTKARLEARIQERVATLLEFELNDPRAGFITVTGVTLTEDLSIATILYSVFGTDADRSKVQHMLEDATGFVRSKVGRVLRVRRIPVIKWRYDDTVELQDRMERTIREAMDRDREINPDAHEER
ncbi:MAG: 30S ribosome-binding factor RbfA [Planctomycetota bacterium]